MRRVGMCRDWRSSKRKFLLTLVSPVEVISRCEGRVSTSSRVCKNDTTPIVPPTNKGWPVRVNVEIRDGRIEEELAPLYRLATMAKGKRNRELPVDVDVAAY